MAPAARRTAGPVALLIVDREAHAMRVPAALSIAGQAARSIPAPEARDTMVLVDLRMMVLVDLHILARVAHATTARVDLVILVREAWEIDVQMSAADSSRAMRPRARYVRLMIRHCMLFVGTLCLSLAVLAQPTQWKAIACTVDRPDFVQGTVLTIYFMDTGLVHFNGHQHTATVTSAEIKFCYPVKDGQFCYTVSRISGRFSGMGTAAAVVSGTCLPQSEQPKF
jgi:hypothetical protein